MSAAVAGPERESFRRSVARLPAGLQSLKTGRSADLNPFLRAVVLSLLLIVGLPAQARSEWAGAHCGREFGACYKACPNNLALSCLSECSTQNDACLKEADLQEKAERAIRQCNALPIDQPQLARAVDGAWLGKKYAIDDGIKTLRKIRADLQSDAKWTVGEPGSVRELSIYLAQVTKSITDLIENLGGFSSEKSTRAVKDVYEEIKRGRTAYEVVTQDTQTVVLNLLLDAASDVSPVARGAKSIKDFTESVIEMTKTPEELKSAREEIKRQLDGIDARINAMQRTLDQIKRDYGPDEISALLQSYRSVHQMCSAELLARP
jgi:hypothetical protein